MFDRDLAELYGVETRVLNQGVRRNLERFPPDFMFELTRGEIREISQFVTSSNIRSFCPSTRLRRLAPRLFELQTQSDR
jgi:hypothetical protein